MFQQHQDTIKYGPECAWGLNGELGALREMKFESYLAFLYAEHKERKLWPSS